MKLIDKDALVAKIKDLKLKLNWAIENFSGAKEIAYDNVLDVISGLEVKEVDSLTPEEIKKICTIYDNLNQERKCATVLYNSDETFFNHVLVEYKSIAQNIKEEVKKDGSERG